MQPYRYARRSREPIQQRAVPQQTTKAETQTMPLGSFEVALLGACESGDVDLLRQVGLSNPELLATTVGAEGDTIAHIAAFYGQAAVLRLVHQMRPTLLSAVTADGRAPAHDAAAAGSAASIVLLAQLGAVGSLLLPGIVRTAAAGGHVGVLHALVATTSGKVDLVDASSDGFTSGHAATACGHVEALSFLHDLRRDSVLATTKPHGWTCAHVAALTGDIKCLSLLSRLGLPLDCHSWPQWPDSATVRPFQIACRTSISCTMHLAVHDVDTSIAVLPGHQEPQQLSEDVKLFLKILRSTARTLSALLRLKFKSSMQSATKNNSSVLLCDDLVEQVGKLLTPARIARANYTAEQVQRASTSLDASLARGHFSLTAGESYGSRKRRCTEQQ